jgi:hypothetical protein
MAKGKKVTREVIAEDKMLKEILTKFDKDTLSIVSQGLADISIKFNSATNKLEWEYC